MFFYYILIVEKLKNKSLRRKMTYNPIYHLLKGINVWGYFFSFFFLCLKFVFPKYRPLIAVYP